MIKWKWLIFIVLVLNLSLFIYAELKVSSKCLREEEWRQQEYGKLKKD